MRADMTRRRRDGRDPGVAGQITVFILGACVLALTLVVAVVNVTAVQLARVRLYDVADAAALDAADEAREVDIYGGGVRGTLPLTDDAVRASAERSLVQVARPEAISSWRLERAGVGAQAGTAVVVLTGDVVLPLGGGLLAAAAGPVTLTVTSSARSLTAASAR
ncbi:MAG: pilus assembly protein TadG-related protein [Dermatophilaceae bacterium]